MKVFIALACLCICAQAAVLHHAPAVLAPAVLASTGTSRYPTCLWA